MVIIVGAVHGQTASYRDRGDAAYAEARKYTPNVTKVYSPNATWSKVKAATTNANIVIYMGHGNGWPSPYTYDPKYTTKDGFGLNATAGNGDYNVKYYGEPYVDDLDLAPNAIVLLHHLCYASGNSEPGKAEPSVSTARQRATNYAAGFLGSPARAVIADGHMGAAYYLRGLFTTNQSILSLWRNAPNYNGNEFSFASTPQLRADRVHGPGLADKELLPLARPEADADHARRHRRRGRHGRRPGHVRRAGPRLGARVRRRVARRRDRLPSPARSPPGPASSSSRGRTGLPRTAWACTR